MKFKQLLRALLISAIGMLAACGGGGGGGTSVAQPSAAILKLSTSGALNQGTALAGIEISVILPAGVTLTTNADGSVAAGVVTVSGVAAPGILTPPIYTPAGGTAPGELTFVVASDAPAGFGTGEFATVRCDIDAGSSPVANDFTPVEFKPVDMNGAMVGGMTANVAVTFL